MIYARMRVLAWVYAGCDLRYAVCDEVKHRGGSRQVRSISDDRCVMHLLRLDAYSTYLVLLHATAHTRNVSTEKTDI